MAGLDMTDHISQQGVRESDIGFVFELGSEVADGVFLRDQDAHRVIRHANMLINLATRLRSTYVVMKDGTLITAYRPNKRKERKLFKR